MAGAGLPEGLITNSEAIADDIDRVDRVVVEDLKRFWRGTDYDFFMACGYSHIT